LHASCEVIKNAFFFFFLFLIALQNGSQSIELAGKARIYFYRHNNTIKKPPRIAAAAAARKV